MHDQSVLFLDGWQSTLQITPLHWPIDLHGSLSVHGALHKIAKIGHDDHVKRQKKPGFILIPTNPQGTSFSSESWNIHFLDPNAYSLAQQTYLIELYGDKKTLQIGEFKNVSIPMPTIGQYEIMLSSQTPMICKTENGEFKTHISTGELIGAIHQLIRKIIKNPFWAKEMKIYVENLKITKIKVNTKWSGKDIQSFLWECKMLANESGYLAIKIAEYFGLGAAISRGFGRFKIQDISKC